MYMIWSQSLYSFIRLHALDFHLTDRKGRHAKDYCLLYPKIRRILKLDCSLTLHGLSRKLRKMYHTRVSPRTCGRALKKMKWSLKVLKKVPDARDTPTAKAHRKEYCDNLLPHSMKSFVFMDESGVNLHTSTRNRGWAPIGQRPCARVPANRGVNLSVVVASHWSLLSEIYKHWPASISRWSSLCGVQDIQGCCQCFSICRIFTRCGGTAYNYDDIPKQPIRYMHYQRYSCAVCCSNQHTHVLHKVYPPPVLRYGGAILCNDSTYLL